MFVEMSEAFSIAILRRSQNETDAFGFRYIVPNKIDSTLCSISIHSDTSRKFSSSAILLVIRALVT